MRQLSDQILKRVDGVLELVVMIIGHTDFKPGRVGAVVIRKKIDKPFILINGARIRFVGKRGFCKLILLIRIDD